VATCGYCGTSLLWDEGGLHDLGKRSLLAEGFTRLWTGATGKLRGRDFVVQGRARYDYGQGFWDEWFLEMSDGSEAWLTEDNHELALQERIEAQVPSRDELATGKRIDVAGVKYAIRESGTARCLGIEGRLPKLVLPDEVYEYVDADSLDGKSVLGIEYDESPPSVYVGPWIAHDELVLDDEGRT
jgi:hypothetical protein